VLLLKAKQGKKLAVFLLKAKGKKVAVFPLKAKEKSSCVSTAIQVGKCTTFFVLTGSC
jgi:hypothetical protein